MKLILIFFTVLASLLCSPFSFAEDFSSLQKTGKATVVDVITPYTIQLDSGKIINLSGIHYPDYDLETPGDFSLTAYQILKDLLPGQQVEVWQTQDKNWGRKNRLGHEYAHIQIIKKDIWAQGILLSLGLAHVRTKQRNPEMAEQMYALENLARSEKSGIWQTGQAIISPDEAHKHIGEFAVIEGRIKAASLNKNRLYLNFGSNWREDFTVSVAPENMRNFTENGLDPMKWNNKHVQVRGYIRSYNGPFMEINHREALILLE